MGKLLKRKAALAALGALALNSTASAQQTANPPIGSAGYVETLSAADFASMFAQLSISTTLTPYENNQLATILAETDGGGRFLVALFGCEDPVRGVNCQAAATYTLFSNAGLTYDDINNVNQTANVSRVANLAEQNVIIFGMQRFFNGGVSKSNLLFETSLFLTDLQIYLDSANAQATPVAAQQGGRSDSADKTGNLTQSPVSGVVVGGLNVSDAYSSKAAIGVAIANTHSVSFKTHKE